MNNQKMFNKDKVVLVFDFDGVFVPLEIFQNVIEKYARIKNKSLSIDLDFIRKYMTQNQDVLHNKLSEIGIDDFNLLADIYQESIILKEGAEEFIRYCQTMKLKYLFCTGAKPERVISVFKKNKITIKKSDIYFAPEKNETFFIEFKQEILRKYGNLNNIIYIDDFPQALKAAKKYDFYTIYVKTHVFPLEDFITRKDNKYNFFDKTIISLNELIQKSKRN